MHLVVYADGASRGNPGPASIGASVQDSSGEELTSVSEAIGRTTNNVAEYRAAIAGVQAAGMLGATSIELRLDSELVVRQLAGRYRVKNAALRPLFAALVEALEAVGPYTVGHVPRERNKRADSLAYEALDSARR